MNENLITIADILAALAIFGGTALLVGLVVFVGQWIVFKIKPIREWWIKHQEKKYGAIFGKQVEYFKTYVDTSLKAIVEENKLKKQRIWDEIEAIHSQISGLEEEIDTLQKENALHKLDNDYMIKHFDEQVDAMSFQMQKMGTQIETLVHYLINKNND